MTVDLYRHRLAYDAWANERIVRALAAMDSAPADALRGIAHIVGAQQVWLGRMKGEALSPEIWPAWGLAETEAHIENMRGAWEMYCDGLAEDDLDTAFDYANSTGQRYTNTIRETLEHLMTHGAYHRGQITAAIRTAGAEPPDTGYITGYIRFLPEDAHDRL